MILVDVYVPSVDQTYDFNLDENAKAQVIIEEIVEMIGQKEHTSIVGSIDRLMLCDRLTRRTLRGDISLLANGIKNGSSMILV